MGDRRIQLNWLSEDRKDRGTKFLGFIISPLIGLLLSLRSINTKSSYCVLFLFAICFGLAFTVGNSSDLNTLDGVRYRYDFEQMCEGGQAMYFYNLKEYLSFHSSIKDYYFDTIAWLTSLFSSNYHILFLLLAIPFAYFQLKSLHFLTSLPNYRFSYLCIMITLFFCWNSIFNINGCRFWTAAWISVYCAFQVFQNGDYKYLILVFLTPFFHGSFYIFIILVGLCLIFSRFDNIWAILFFLSFLYSSLAVGVVQNASIYLPDFLVNLVDYYTGEENMSRYDSVGGIYSFFKTISSLFPSLCAFILVINRKTIKCNGHNQLYAFLLILMAFSNFTMPIPSLGNRFIVLSYPIIAYLWLSNFGIGSNAKYSWVFYAFPFIWLAEFKDYISLYSLVTDIKFYFLSPIYQVITAVL